MEEKENIKPEVKAEEASAKPSPKGQHNRSRSTKRSSRGLSRAQEEKLFDEKVVKISRVTKVIKGGKRMRFSALVVIGDGKGRYGYGLGKSGEVPEAIKKAIASARKNLKKIEIAKGGTITHPIKGKFGAAQVFLKPAPEGTGLIAGGAVRAILELAGIKNVYSKVYGSRTQANVVKATMDGLSQLKTYSEVSLLRFGKTVETKTEAEAK